MRAVGIVVEYNPFHNGHKYHIQQAKEHANADVVIAVMSGQFLQRGEPAFVDKWFRTKMALLSGVDLIVELPYVYSTAQATDFAKGAITLLSAIGCESFAFGSENGELTPFLNTYHLIENHRPLYNELIRHYMKSGYNYPKALHAAYEQLKQNHPDTYIDLTQPNNILGFHYIEAANKLSSTISPLTIPRIEVNYYDDITEGQTIASATGIRKAIFEQQQIDVVKPFVPDTTYQLLLQWQSENSTFSCWESFWPLLQFAIIRHTPKQLTDYVDVSEGIEFALIKAAKSSDSFKDFMLKIKSKRYTWTRIQRMLTHIYTGFTKTQLQNFTGPSYMRILGMTTQGQTYLSAHKKQFSLPLISRVGATSDPMLQIDVHATDMYALGVKLRHANYQANDYQTPPIRI